MSTTVKVTRFFIEEASKRCLSAGSRPSVRAAQASIYGAENLPDL